MKKKILKETKETRKERVRLSKTTTEKIIPKKKFFNFDPVLDFWRNKGFKI